MSDLFDITTFGRDDLYGPKRIEARRETPKKAPQAADKAAELQRELDRATLALSSARRTLRAYRLGQRAIAASAATGALSAVAGMATAIATSVAGADATAVVLWLFLFGVPMATVSAFGLFAWHRLHRIKYEWIKRSGYTYSTYVIDSKDYVDPQHNVEMAELEYGRALAKVTEQNE